MFGKYEHQRCSRILIVFLLFTFNLKVLAKENCKVNNANDILRCLQSNHPEVISESIVNSVSRKLEQQNNSWRNPEFSFQTVGGQNLGSNIFESELRISQTVEFSGQKIAKKKQVHGSLEFFKAEGNGKIEDITLSGVKSLYRVVQINNELLKIEESVKKFKSIRDQYQSRPKLNPEQEITLGIIQLAISEFEIKRNQIDSEKNELLSDLTANSGIGESIILNNLPRPILNWPEITQSKNSESNSLIQKLKAEVDISRANLDLAKAEAWPDFTIDLIIQNNIDGSLQYQTFGAGIRLPFPLFQRNEGEKSLKSVELSKVQNVFFSAKQKQESQFQNLKRTYSNSILNLNNTPSDESIEKKHKKAEHLFSQGMISGPLIIETHRQIVEYIESRNQEEMRAIESLWRLHILSGKIFEEKI